MKLITLASLLAVAMAAPSVSFASVNETNSTPCSTLTVYVRQDSYTWSGSQWQYSSTSLWNSSLSYGASLVLMDWQDSSYRIDYSVSSTSSVSTESWSSFDEPQAWSYGSWSPSASSVPSCQWLTQTRTKTRQHRTGERSNCGNERNVSWYTESATDSQSTMGTAPANWAAFTEVLSGWQEVSASPSCSTVPASQSFTQSYTEQRSVRTGERNACGEERNVTVLAEWRTNSRTLSGCGS